MRPFFRLLLLLVFALPLLGAGCGDDEAAPVTDVLADDGSPLMSTFYAIDTRYGTMVVGLYDGTPVHRDNFDSLATAAYYDSTAFHRVIENFMIQGGDPNSRDDLLGDDGSGDPGYTLPAEFHPALFHKKGALSAARKGDPVNPEKRSSGSQFYIVQGQPLTDAELDEIEAQRRQSDPDFAFTDAQREVYRTLGGTPFLDGDYTVFGEVVEGLDVLDAIAATETARKTGRPAPPQLADQPLERVFMTVLPLPDYER
jgi:peptidyl-prolyl cis-trans isomerase B (cyclophilin B)